MKWLVIAIVLGVAATFASLEALAQGWLTLPSHILSNPDPANAWLYGLGFLGLVVLRRTRSGPMS